MLTSQEIKEIEQEFEYIKTIIRQTKQDSASAYTIAYSLITVGEICSVAQ